MSGPDTMPLSTSAYLADTTQLSNSQHGCYLLILMAMWRAGGWIADNDRTIANIVKLSPAKWIKVSGPVRALLIAQDGKLTQKRLQIEIEKALKKISQNTQNGTAGGIAKSLKTKTPALPNATGSPQPTANATTLKTLEPELGLEDSGSKGSPSPPKAKRARPRAVISSEWQPSAKGFAYAADAGYRGQYVRTMVQKFKNNHQAKGTLMADPDAYWRMWVDKEVEFSRARTNGAQRPPSFLSMALTQPQESTDDPELKLIQNR